MDKYELHLIIDNKGLKEVQIIGVGEGALYRGRKIYLKIKPLFSDFNEEIKRILYEEDKHMEKI